MGPHLPAGETKKCSLYFGWPCAPQESEVLFSREKENRKSLPETGNMGRAADWGGEGGGDRFIWGQDQFGEEMIHFQGLRLCHGTPTPVLPFPLDLLAHTTPCMTQCM